MPGARMAGVMQASSGPGARTFATKAASFQCVFRIQDTDPEGYTYTKEEWVIPFFGSKSGQFGCFTTTDRRVQEFFDERIKRQREVGEEPDVMDLADFMEVITPPAIKAKALEAEVRRLTEHNEMLKEALKGHAVVGLGQAEKPEPAEGRTQTGTFAPGHADLRKRDNK